jgi:hypothetical protein
MTRIRLEIADGPDLVWSDATARTEVTRGNKEPLHFTIVESAIARQVVIALSERRLVKINDEVFRLKSCAVNNKTGVHTFHVETGPQCGHPECDNPAFNTVLGIQYCADHIDWAEQTMIDND